MAETMAGGGDGGGRKADRELLSAVAWMRQHGEPIDEEILEEILHIGRTAKRASVRLAAYREFLLRWDPVPTRPLIAATLTGPTVLVWDLSAQEIPPASEPRALRPGSSAGSNGSTSSSVIEAGERPPSE